MVYIVVKLFHLYENCSNLVIKLQVASARALRCGEHTPLSPAGRESLVNKWLNQQMLEPAKLYKTVATSRPRGINLVDAVW